MRAPPRIAAVARSAGVVFLAALLAGCASRALRPPAPASAPVVDELRSLADLAAHFDRDRAHPRVVLLLSPT